MQKIIQILIFAIISNFGYSQNIEPIDLAKKLLSKDEFENIDKYSTGEFNGHPNAQDFDENVSFSYRVLDQAENTAVINVTIKDSAGTGLDTYLHFEKDSIWKINAFRALAMTGMLEQIKNEFEKLTDTEIDSLIEAEKDEKHKMFESKEDFKNKIGNIKLTLEFDDNIIKHFNENKDEFERLKNLALSEIETIDSNVERSSKLLENLDFEYKKILIASISNGGYGLDNCLNFYIGGLVDNEVGYIYVKDKKDLPKMNPNRIIMIREIGDGWYLYKTT